MIKELKPTIRRFGAISASMHGSKPDYAAINSWRAAADRVRIFGGNVSEVAGVNNIKHSGEVPTLREVFQDHYRGLRGNGIIVVTSPNISIVNLANEISKYADLKKMSIAWSFYSPEINPSVFGFTPSVSKILSEEVPEEILFSEDSGWQEWLSKWIKRSMLPHRRFVSEDIISSRAIATVKISELAAKTSEPVVTFDKRMDEMRNEIIANQDDKNRIDKPRTVRKVKRNEA